MKEEVLAIAVFAVIVLALVVKGKEQPISPVLPPEPEPELPPECIVIGPAPQPRPVLPPEPVLPPRPAPPPTPPVRPPANIKPLPNPLWEWKRREFAYDLKRRGWQEVYKRFLLETNPNQPGSASVGAIEATYRAIFRETV